MTDVAHRTRGHAKRRLPKPERLDMEALLGLPQAQEIIRRIGEATDPDYPNRAEHVAHVAAVVVRAKMCPNNAYAKATL